VTLIPVFELSFPGPCMLKPFKLSVVASFPIINPSSVQFRFFLSVTIPEITLPHVTSWPSSDDPSDSASWELAGEARSRANIALVKRIIAIVDEIGPTFIIAILEL
jgi:hypothetical protein